MTIERCTEQDRTNGTLILLAFLATAAMLFAAFTAAYLIRRTAADWQSLPLPALVWVNTTVLLVSSVALEVARRSRSEAWLGGALFLGAAFVVGQVIMWSQMSSAGVFLSSHPHNAFLYVLSGVHALHVLGGIGGLIHGLLRRTNLALSSLYWHFVDVVWLYLVLVLVVL